MTILFKTALAVFVITTAIGLVNGQRVLVLGRPVLLTHVHTGTLGWITLNMVAVVLWLFTAGQPASVATRAGVRRLARFAAVAIGGYPVTFFLFYPGGPLGSGAALGVFGTLALVAIVWLLGWTIRQSRAVYLSVARLAALGAVVNLTLGAILGVLIEAQFAGLNLPVGDVFGAHPALLTVGYIVPIGLTIAEWWLKGGADGRRDRLGVVSVALLVLAGWLVAAGVLLDQPLLLLLMPLCQIAAVLLFAIRLAPRLLRVRWLAATGERHVAVTALAVVLDVALLVYLIAITVPSGAEVPHGALVAHAHTEFIGIITNACFALLGRATARRRETIWPWADQAIFWAVNVGWVGFAAVELAGAVELIRVFTPIMGLGILLAIATYALRLAALATSAAPLPLTVASER